MSESRPPPVTCRPWRSHSEWALTAAPFLWLIVLFAAPTAVVVFMSLREAAPSGGLGDAWSLRAWRDLAHPIYPVILWRTLRLSLIATALCLALALPVAFLAGRAAPRLRSILILLIVVPFWTNFLIRVFAWRVLLQPEGMLRRALLSFGWIEESTLLMYNEWTVLLVMVYTYLPFAILPLYAAAERFDYGLLDAARDLGASAAGAFCRVFLPGISRGLLAALAMVLIPALGSYVIPDLVGGPGQEMLGNKIAQRTFVDRNLPHAAALATLLIAVAMLPVAAAFLFARPARPAAEEGGTS
ncbi:MAG TPA: ABC transporter permease [Verrucomicrobiales bacterium]|nr:ABC transporter permease [Verrucomicrobiales bacterium]